MRWRARLRQANAVVAALLAVCLVLHGIGNSFELFGVGLPGPKVLARVTATLAIVHALAGVILTVDSVRAQMASGVAYVRLNSRFWASRISGLAIAVFAFLHVAQFLSVGMDTFRLRLFDALQLAFSLALVASLIIHVVVNALPAMISLGVPQPPRRAGDVAFALSVLLLVMGVAFVVYFVRWSVV